MTDYSAQGFPLGPQSQTERQRFKESENTRKLFIGGLATETNDETLAAFFGQWGKIDDCYVARDLHTGKSRRFGFIVLASEQAVEQALAARPHMVDGHTVDTKRAVPREDENQSINIARARKIYVSGVNHTEQALQNYFQQFGRIMDVDIQKDASGIPRGSAYITFEDHDSADKCVIKKRHEIEGQMCEVRKALSQEELLKAGQKERERQERQAFIARHSDPTTRKRPRDSMDYPQGPMGWHGMPGPMGPMGWQGMPGPYGPYGYGFGWGPGPYGYPGGGFPGGYPGGPGTTASRPEEPSTATPHSAKGSAGVPPSYGAGPPQGYGGWPGWPQPGANAGWPQGEGEKKSADAQSSWWYSGR